ncbi:hypothetical protein GE09DRAFT_1231096 [Coniochaeta sp. 2T2.1]|nr:hypothetical protein GE09DRAFT_1231096 [Coniochaeta sp. 2T2.1]
MLQLREILKSALATPTADRPNYDHFGINFPCFFCRQDVRDRFKGPQSADHKAADVYYFAGDRVNNEYHPTFMGCATLRTLHNALQNNGHDRGLKGIHVASKNAVIIRHCSEEEGYGLHCFDKSCGNHERTLFMAHKYCVKASRSYLGCMMSMGNMLDLAHHTRFIPPVTADAFGGRTESLVATPATYLKQLAGCSMTPLADLFGRMVSLPQEVIDMIISELVPKGSKTGGAISPRWTHGYRLLELGPVRNVSKLSARMTSIFGKTYVSALSLDSDIDDPMFTLSIPITSDKIRGLQVAIAQYGLRALQVLYLNDSTSPWLGNPAGCWLGIVGGTNQTVFEVGSDSPLYDFYKISDPKRVARYSLGLWDTDMTHQKGQLAHILPRDAYRPKLVFHATSRLCNHLSLIRDSEYASGITFFCCRESIHGVKAHFTSGSTFLGAEKGQPVHSAFAEGEYLTSAWTDKNETTKPSWEDWIDPPWIVAVTTSRNRTAYFGSVTAREMLDDTLVDDWECMSYGFPTRITGFILDTAVYRSQKVFREMGVTEDKDFANKLLCLQPGRNDHHLPDIEKTQAPYYDWQDSANHFWAQNLFLATASLDRVARALDGTVETLGRWDPERKDTVAQIYDVETDGPLTGLEFICMEETFHINTVTATCGSTIDRTVTVARTRKGDAVWSRTWEVSAAWRLAWFCGFPDMLLGAEDEDEDEDDVAKMILTERGPEAFRCDEIWCYLYSMDKPQRVVLGKKLEAIL